MLPTIHFIHPWFPSKTGHNMPYNPLYRDMLPQWFQVNVFLVGALHMTNHFIEGKLAFNQEAFAAAMALYSKRDCGKPFYRGWTWTGPVYTGVGAARKDAVNPFYRAEMLANHFIEEGLGPVQFIQKAGAARNDVAKPVYRAELPAGHFIEEGLEPVQFIGGFTRSGHCIEAFAVRRGMGEWDGVPL